MAERDFDVVVIGAGIGGLMCAAALAVSGSRVLVVERHQQPGGYCSSFRRRGYVFDCAVDCFGGAGPDGIFPRLLNALGLPDAVRFVRVDPIRESMFPHGRVRVPGSLEAYRERLCAMFPEEREGIRKALAEMSRIYRAAQERLAPIRDVPFWREREDPSAGTALAEVLLEYGRMTYRQFLDRFVSRPELHAVLSDRCPFLGLPPDRVAAVTACIAIMSYFHEGAYRVAGGCQKLSNALVRGIRSKGSAVWIGREVRRILVRGGQACGVQLDDGREIRAEAVVSNGDYKKTFRDLVGEAHLPPGFLRRLEGRRVSSSFFLVYLGVDLPVGDPAPVSSLGCFPSLDSRYAFGFSDSFDPRASFGITIPTLLDPSMAPRGKHVVVIHKEVLATHVRHWNAQKHAMAARLVDKAASVLPGLREGIEHMEIATPWTLERYTGNTQGAAYGWEQTPGQKPLEMPIRNLLVAGHWGAFGGGILSAAYSGCSAARSLERCLEGSRR